MRKRQFERLITLSQSACKLPGLVAFSSASTNEKVSFGSQNVDPKDKPFLVDQVFSSVANRYDLMNDLMSGGVHRIWKDYFVSQIPLLPHMKHLDVAGGTGDIAYRLLHRAAGYHAEITVADLSEDMVQQGKQKPRSQDIQWVVADAEDLPFDQGAFHSYSIAFGLRNVTHINEALAEAYRVLKPGGLFACLEFSHVRSQVLKTAYDLYSFSFIPLLGQVVTGDKAAYQYLVESIRSFPDQESLSEKILSAGFHQVSYENLLEGVVAIHIGLKPPDAQALDQKGSTDVMSE